MKATFNNLFYINVVNEALEAKHSVLNIIIDSIIVIK